MSLQNNRGRRPYRTIIRDGAMPARPVQTYQVNGVTLVDFRSAEDRADDLNVEAKRRRLIAARPHLFEDTFWFLRYSPSGSPCGLIADGDV